MTNYNNDCLMIDKQTRNQKMFDYAKDHPEATFEQIGNKFNISRQRARTILIHLDESLFNKDAIKQRLTADILKNCKRYKRQIIVEDVLEEYQISISYLKTIANENGIRLIRQSVVDREKLVKTIRTLKKNRSDITYVDIAKKLDIPYQKVMRTVYNERSKGLDI